MELIFQWAVVGLLATTLYSIALACYRLYFHPLAGLPGPRLAAATGWYETYIDLFQRPRGNFMEEITRMHAKFGMPFSRVCRHQPHPTVIVVDV